MSQAGFTIKVAFGGDSATGKTSVISKLKDPDANIDQVDVTVGVEYQSMPLKVNEGTRDERSGVAQLIDVPGSEGYSTIRTIHYRDADFVVLVFAINSRASFESLTKWFDSVKDIAPGNARYIVVGNKVDLTDLRAVSEAEGDAAAQKFSEEPIYFEVSALTGLAIHSLREHIAAETPAILRDRETGKPGPPCAIQIDTKATRGTAKNDDCC
jgi:small GTP-binding protein